MLNYSKSLDRRFVTRDKDFGALVYVYNELSSGVILLRINPRVLNEVHTELKRLLDDHNEKELRNIFGVVEPHRYRIRKL